MKMIGVILTGLLILSGCMAVPNTVSGDAVAQGKYADVKVSRLIRVYDGDTFICDIDELSPLAGKNIRVRLKHINTPEINEKDKFVRMTALAEKQRLENLLNNAKVIELRNIDRGKYFRILADVYVDGEPLLAKLNPIYLTRKGK